jgi:solute carrier family 25 carnitine/acylcarnitine transporter 20/29
MAEFLVTFAAGASYGLTTVVVGQPLDTIKVRMQGLPSATKQSALAVGRDLFQREGMRGLYRGGVPLFLGGSVMRSAQFGVSGRVKHWMEEHPHLPHFKMFGLLDWQVIAAGVAGGLGRGLVEIPTDFIKTRQQVEHSWTWSHVMDGTAITLMRNTVLYTAFMLYVDLAKQACVAGHVPSMLMNEQQNNLTPFLKGAICANMAWLTVWVGICNAIMHRLVCLLLMAHPAAIFFVNDQPADVVKTQRQSGNYDDSKGLMKLFQENMQNGRFFRGLVPGLVRSSIANGSSMVVYEFVLSTLTERFGLERRDMA